MRHSNHPTVHLLNSQDTTRDTEIPNKRDGDRKDPQLQSVNTETILDVDQFAVGLPLHFLSEMCHFRRMTLAIKHKHPWLIASKRIRRR